MGSPLRWQVQPMGSEVGSSPVFRMGVHEFVFTRFYQNSTDHNYRHILLAMFFIFWPFCITTYGNGKVFKGLPGCFFTRTSLLKSSNILEPIYNKVNIKSSWLVIFRIISVAISFTVWGTHTTNGNLKNLKVIIFPIPWYFIIYNARFSLPLSIASMV